jgi:O-antigen/teichoic acid export membrane protein
MISYLYSRIRSNSSFTGAVATLAGGTVIAQVVTALSMPIVSRIYTPREIGIISLFISFFGFWSMLLSWRYESALLVTKGEEDTRAVLKLGTNIVYFMSVISGPVIYGLVSWRILGFDLLPWWSALVAPLIFLGYGLFMLHRGFALRNGLVNRITHATMARSICNATTRIVFGIAGAGVAGLFAAELAGAWGATGTLRKGNLSQLLSQQGKIRIRAWFTAATRYAAFAKYEMPSVLLDQLALTLPVPIIASIYGAEAAGWFGLARILVALPNAQIGRAVADVFQMELARKIRNGEREQARKLFYKLLNKLAIFGLIPLATIMVIGPLLAPWIFGKPWMMMGFITAYISPWLYAALIVSSLSRLLSVLERQKYKFVYDVFALSFVILEYLCAKHYRWDLTNFVIILSVLNVVAYGIYLFVLLWVVKMDLSDKHVL